MRKQVSRDAQEEFFVEFRGEFSIGLGREATGGGGELVGREDGRVGNAVGTTGGKGFVRGDTGLV